MKRTFVWLALFSLCGCAESWTKPGALTGEFETTKADCVREAAAQFPPNIQQQGNYMNTVMGTQGGVCTGGPFPTCTGATVGPLPTTVDVNANARNQAARSCLVQHGWHPS
jgi:hypothetical protein